MGKKKSHKLENFLNVKRVNGYKHYSVGRNTSGEIPKSSQIFPTEAAIAILIKNSNKISQLSLKEMFS